MRTVFFQLKNGEFISSNVFTAWYGFREWGYECHKFEADKVEELPLNEDCIVVGGIPIVHKAFAKLGIAIPKNIDIPDSLVEFAKRKVWATTIHEARKLESRLFIKPLAEHKIFHGHVINKIIDLATTSFLPDDYPILASEPVNFVSEYRYYVVDHEIIGVGHYRGDPFKFPEEKAVKAAVAAFAGQPRSFSIDFGVLDNGDTALVEVNDAYALGNYSLPWWLYAKLIEVRWDELLNRQSSPHLKYIQRP